MDKGWTHKPLHPPQLIQLRSFPCFKCILSKARYYSTILILSYFFLDEKVSKKSRLISLKGHTLAIRRMLSVISSQARSFLCIQHLLASAPNLPTLQAGPFAVAFEREYCHSACPHRIAQQFGSRACYIGLANFLFVLFSLPSLRLRAGTTHAHQKLRFVSAFAEIIWSCE